MLYTRILPNYIINSMSEKSPMTVAGHKALQEELHYLKTVERPSIVKDIEEARAHGDLSENAEYDAAKNAQGLSEAKIRELEAQLSTAQVVDVTKLSGTKVIFGATVDLVDMDTDQKKTIMIVGDNESDVDQGKLSYQSPLARGLIGKSVDDFVEVNLPGGKKEYEITAVRFEDR